MTTIVFVIFNGEAGVVVKTAKTKTKEFGVCEQGKTEKNHNNDDECVSFLF